MIHRISDETCRSIGMATAALDGAHGDVRRRRHAQRNLSIVTGRTIRIGRLVDIGATCPARETCGRTRMARATVLTVRCDVIDV
jgi:hypothetical protein